MKKYENFCAAFKKLLAVYEYQPPYDTVILTGLVALFEICFEQSWKTVKEILEREGFSESQTGSPRQILKTAYAAGLIKEEKLWLEALASRNNVAHAYNEAVALDILNAVKKDYYNMFSELIAEIQNNWL